MVNYSVFGWRECYQVVPQPEKCVELKLAQAFAEAILMFRSRICSPENAL
jgi:hypothetical protein